MAVDVVSDILIRRPLQVVADYAADPDNAPRWYVNIKSVEWLTPRPAAVGSRIAFVAQFLGRRLAYVYEIVEFRPRQLMIMRTAQGPFPMETVYRWQDKGAATRMVLQNRGAPAGFGKLVAPFMAMAMRRANRKDLIRLKQTLEQ
jgi:uncharacterized membrane protein